MNRRISTDTIRLLGGTVYHTHWVRRINGVATADGWYRQGPDWSQTAITLTAAGWQLNRDIHLVRQWAQSATL